MSVNQYFKNWNRDSLAFMKKMGELARQEGGALYLVGGVVRDALMGRKPLDFDFVVEGDALSFVRRVSRFWKVKPTIYSQFGTARFRMNGYGNIDLAGARREYYPYPGALPVVSRGTIEEDLFRRDFTINAMAITLNPDAFGRLVDPWAGRRDLERQKIRALHSRSFQDDPTRVLRAVRFEQRFGFKIEPLSLSLLKQAIAERRAETVKPPRYFAEFRKILREENPLRGLRRLHQLGGLDFMEENFPLDCDKIRRVDASGAPASIRPRLYLLALLAELEASRQSALFRKFQFTAKEQKSFLQIRHISGIIDDLLTADSRPSAVYWTLKPLELETVWYLYSQTRDKKLAALLRRYLEKDRYCSLRINGEDLKNLGVRSGRKIGCLLKKTLCFKMDHGFRDKQDELNFIQTMMKSLWTE